MGKSSLSGIARSREISCFDQFMRLARAGQARQIGRRSGERLGLHRRLASRQQDHRKPGQDQRHAGIAHRRKHLAEQPRRGEDAGTGRQQRERRHRPGLVALQQMAPGGEAEIGGDGAEIDHRQQSLPGGVGERGPDGDLVEGGGQRQGRKRRHQAAPGKQREDRRLIDALHQHVAGGPGKRGGEAQSQGSQLQITADGERDQRQSCEGHRHAGDLPARRMVAQENRSQENGEEHLDLLRHRSEAGRQPRLIGEEHQQKLAGEQRQPDQDDIGPGHARPPDEDDRQSRDDEAQRGQLRRREIDQRDLDGGKGEAPHHRGADGERHVAAAHDRGGAVSGKAQDQWRKCRIPVKTIAIPALSAAAITSLSRTEPPGWIAAVAPAAMAASSPSAKGKKASDATTQLLIAYSFCPDALAASAAFCTAIRTLSTRLICPAPTPTVAPPLAKTMALDLTCFATVKANSKSAISAWLGARWVTVLSWLAETRPASRVCARNPPASDLIVMPPSAGSGIAPAARIRSAVFFFRMSSAPGSTEGAITTSANSLEIASAVAASSARFMAMMSPKALTGSQASARSQAARRLAATATPQGWACLTMTRAGSENSPASS